MQFNAFHRNVKQFFRAPILRHRLELGPQARERLLDRAAAGLEHLVRLGIERGPALEDAAQVVHRLAIAGVAGHRAGVALREHAAHVLLRRRPHPHGVALGEQQAEGRRVGDDAARRRDDGLREAPDRLLERALLVAPIGCRPVERMDLGEAAAGDRFDAAVQLDERHLPALGEQAAEGALAGAAQADQRDPLAPRRLVRRRAEQRRQRGPRLHQLGLGAAVQDLADHQPLGRARGLVADQLGERAVERLRELAQELDRCVADAHLDVGEVALGDVGGSSRGPCASARGADAARACARRARPGTGPSGRRRCGPGWKGPRSCPSGLRRAGRARRRAL